MVDFISLTIIFRPSEYHQDRLENLGDRDYDSFDYSEHEELKKKIGFHLFAYPSSESGYDQKQNKEINDLFKKILQESSKYQT